MRPLRPIEKSGCGYQRRSVIS